MKSYTELHSLINKHIAESHFGEHPPELYQPITYMMGLGGKRLRPVLVLMACNMFDKPVEKALNAALAVEVFHNFTLVHDDIMDNAPLRRGKETVYKKWNLPVAILSGDLMLIKATELLCKTDTENLPELLRIFNSIATKVCEGQQVDMNFETATNITHAQYIDMICLKTAVLLGCSLQLGALIGGAGAKDASHLYEFGKNIGIAFQIQDDILDSFGDGSQTGKQVGGDIASNKKTVLLIELLEAAHKDDKKQIEQLFTLTDTPKKIENILWLYKKYQVKEFAQSCKDTYLKTAFEHLQYVNVGATKKAVLIETANELMNRIS